MYYGIAQCLARALACNLGSCMPHFDFEAQNVTTPPFMPSISTCWYKRRPTKRCTRLHAYKPHRTPWADVPSQDKTGNSCFGALLRTSGAKMPYGYDVSGITPSIERTIHCNYQLNYLFLEGPQE